MFYTWHSDRLIRRFVPWWFRRGAVNMALARVAVGGVRRIQQLLAPVQEQLTAEYGYNGLKHSLERLLNDRWDAVERRIYITIPDQTPSLYCQDIEEPGTAWYDDVEELSAYHFQDIEEGGIYDHEFVVHIPAVVEFLPAEVFALLEVYRYAGRRPKINVVSVDDDEDILPPIPQ